MPAAHPVRHLHLGQIQVLRSLAQLLASHGILDEGSVGNVGGWKPETHVGAGRFLLVCRLHLHLLLPFHKFLQLRVVVLSHVVTDSLHDVGQLTLIAARIGNKIAHHATQLLPTEVGILKFALTDLRSENREKHRNQGFVHVF